MSLLTNHRHLYRYLLALLLLSACQSKTLKSPVLSPALSQFGNLTPFLTSTPTASATVLPAASETAQPNPTSQPVPEAGTPSMTLPTPLAVRASPPNCYPTLDGGLNCFSLVSNPFNSFVENIAVNFQMVDPDTHKTTSLSAATLLNLAPPGWGMAVQVYFPGPIPAQCQITVELVNALPYNLNDQRYMNVQVSNRQDNLTTDQLSAAIQADLTLEGNKNIQASAVWVAGTAFDAQNNVVGVRRWESTGPLIGGMPVHFSLHIYSAGPKIDHLTLLAEAHK